MKKILLLVTFIGLFSGCSNPADKIAEGIVNGVAKGMSCTLTFGVPTIKLEFNQIEMDQLFDEMKVNRVTNIPTFWKKLPEETRATIEYRIAKQLNLDPNAVESEKLTTTYKNLFAKGMLWLRKERLKSNDIDISEGKVGIQSSFHAIKIHIVAGDFPNETPVQNMRWCN